MTAAGLSASYIHFYGLVLSGGAFLALLAISVQQGKRLWCVIYAILLFSLLAAGVDAVRPRFSRYVDPKTAPEGGRKIYQLLRLVYRLVAHPAIAVSSIAVGLCLIGGAIAFLMAIARLIRSAQSRVVAAGLIICLGSGVAVVTAAQLVQSGFDALSPSYNLWILPGLALFLVSALDEHGPNRAAISHGLGLGSCS